MKHILSLVALMGTLCLAGCDYSDRPSDQQVLSSEPELIGKLPDGRAVRMYTLNWRHEHGDYRHHVYVVDGSTTVSVNSAIHSGKVTYPTTDVTVSQP